MQNIKGNLVDLEHRIEAACAAAGRSRQSVQLIAVSKTKPQEDVRAAYALGMRHFGENYLAEAVQKITATQDLQAVWHFIGRIQSNKTRQIATHFQWVHTVERLKIAHRLNDQCPDGKKLNVLLQVNVDADPHKAGVAPDEVESLLEAISELPNLIPRGLMTILSHPDHAAADPGVGYRSVAQLADRLRPLISTLLPPDRQQWDTLSLGMTADLEQAIAAGATQIRIGTALFGART